MGNLLSLGILCLGHITDDWSYPNNDVVNIDTHWADGNPHLTYYRRYWSRYWTFLFIRLILPIEGYWGSLETEVSPQRCIKVNQEIIRHHGRYRLTHPPTRTHTRTHARTHRHRHARTTLETIVTLIADEKTYNVIISVHLLLDESILPENVRQLFRISISLTIWDHLEITDHQQILAADAEKVNKPWKYSIKKPCIFQVILLSW